MDGKPNPALVNDYTVRGMSQDVTRTLNIGLWEGIGHAAVGWFFNRTLTYTLDLSNANTVAGSGRQMTVSADMASWIRVANEMVWEGTRVPAARIPLLKPDNMKVPERVKAWSLIDYVFRRDPQFYFALEKTTKRGAKGMDQVSAAFKGQTRLSLEELDEQWRLFWAKGEDIRATMRGAEQRNEMPVRRAINTLRRSAELPLLGARRVESSTALGLATFVPNYMKAVKRRAKLMEESAKKAKEVEIPIPPPGEPDFVVAWNADADKALERLLASPGCRDVLINPHRMLVSLFVEKEFVGCDLRPLPGRAPKKLAGLAFPFDNATDVPCSVDLADLGDTLGTALIAAAAEDGANVEVVGYPITLHTFAPLPFTPQGTCVVRAGDAEISGRMILPRTAIEGTLLDRRIEAPGMFVFLPDAPLPSGVRVTVEWTVPTVGRLVSGFETR